MIVWKGWRLYRHTARLPVRRDERISVVPLLPFSPIVNRSLTIDGYVDGIVGARLVARIHEVIINP